MQYGRWLGDFVTGDLGSYYTVTGDRPVMDRVARRAAGVAPAHGLRPGPGAGRRHPARGARPPTGPGSRFDKAANATAFGLLAIPNFALALVLAYYVGVRARVVAGQRLRRSPARTSSSTSGAWSLPAITLAVGQIAVYMRLLRSDMIATLQEDFITMAKSKGMSPPAGAVAPRPAARRASRCSPWPGSTSARSSAARSSIEVIFSIPGIGTPALEAITARQYIALQSLVAIIAIGYVLVNFLVDILYAVLDPRIRHART